MSVSAVGSSFDTSSACNIMGPSPSRFAPFFFRRGFTASAELRYAPVWTQQVRIERWPWPPSHWSFRRPLPSAPRCRPRCHFRQARARLHAVSRQPAAASRSAYPVACTAPACGAKPHEYPSYVPLRLTVGLDKGKVNAKGIPGRYRGNEGKGYRADLKALFQFSLGTPKSRNDPDKGAGSTGVDLLGKTIK